MKKRRKGKSKLKKKEAGKWAMIEKVRLRQKSELQVFV